MLLASASYSNANWEALVKGRLESINRLESDYAEFQANPEAATETHEEFSCDLYGTQHFSASKTVDSNANTITFKFKTDAERCVSSLNDDGYDYEVNHGVFEKRFVFYLDDSEGVERIDYEETRTGIADLITTDTMLQENLDNLSLAKAEEFSVMIDATWLATTEETIYHIDGRSVSNFVFYENDIRYSLSGTVTYTTTDNLVITDSGGFTSMIFDISTDGHVMQTTLDLGTTTRTCDGSPC
ncbi:hypothetical protein [Reinekea sp. G2M2-21]|uniref:hypothetical protein n=1 Tax=Reinekea sp. G2M2-21 TaxID=2788942 RepID=UPI0018AA8D37|nr:hypothetical protein [Reinekea sp. G2M2-21]